MGLATQSFAAGVFGNGGELSLNCCCAKIADNTLSLHGLLWRSLTYRLLHIHMHPLGHR